VTPTAPSHSSDSTICKDVSYEVALNRRRIVDGHCIEHRPDSIRGRGYGRRRRRHRPRRGRGRGKVNKALFKWPSALYAGLDPTWVLTNCSVSGWLGVKHVSALLCRRAAFLRELETARPAAVDGGPHVLSCREGCCPLRRSAADT